jgi:hypothetical protein
LQIKTKNVSCHTADSKPIKQEVNGTVLLSPLVFPDLAIITPTILYLEFYVGKRLKHSKKDLYKVNIVENGFLKKESGIFKYFRGLC